MRKKTRQFAVRASRGGVRRVHGAELMRRFFRSAAFPILIVIVLAFFAQRLISNPSSEPTPTYGQFVSRSSTTRPRSSR